MRNASIAIALVVSLAASSGCATYGASKGVAKTGGITMLVGAAILAIGIAGVVREDHPSDLYGWTVAGVLVLGVDGILAGATVGAAGLIGMATHDKDAAKREDVNEAAATAVDQRTVKAWAMTRTAIDAAHADDCDLVRKLDGQVLALDAEIHATTFLDDPAIKRCLAP